MNLFSGVGSSLIYSNQRIARPLLLNLPLAGRLNKLFISVLSAPTQPSWVSFVPQILSASTQPSWVSFVAQILSAPTQPSWDSFVAQILSAPTQPSWVSFVPQITE